jgi:hypothetical protein
MAKSSVIMALITLIVMIIASVINTLCCVCSPLAAAVLGLIAGGLCVYFEKQTDPEKAMVRGAIAGTIAGAAALVGTTIGGAVQSGVRADVANFLDSEFFFLFVLLRVDSVGRHGRHGRIGGQAVALVYPSKTKHSASRRSHPTVHLTPVVFGGWIVRNTCGRRMLRTLTFGSETGL